MPTFASVASRVYIYPFGIYIKQRREMAAGGRGKDSVPLHVLASKRLNLAMDTKIQLSVGFLLAALGAVGLITGTLAATILGLIGSVLLLYAFYEWLRKRGQTNARPELSSEPETRTVVSQSAVDGDVITAGGDVVVHKTPPAPPVIPWPKRPGGPVFMMSPGIDNGCGHLLSQFQIRAQTMPGGVEARWVGGGTNSDWQAPMPENRPGHFQMKGVAMNPKRPVDEVSFEVRFYLDDGLHGGRWTWRLHQHEKGYWEMPRGAEDVGQPKEFW